VAEAPPIKSWRGLIVYKDLAMKKNIYQIMVKGLADSFRKEFPELRIEGHPGPSPTLLFKKQETKDSILLYIYPGRNKRGVEIAERIFVQARIGVRGSLIASKRPGICLDLNDINSIDTLEEWIRSLVKEALLKDEECMSN